MKNKKNKRVRDLFIRELNQVEGKGEFKPTTHQPPTTLKGHGEEGGGEVTTLAAGEEGSVFKP